MRDADAADILRLRFIGRDIGDIRQKLFRYGGERSGIQHHGNMVRSGKSCYMEVDLHGDLQLQHDHIALCDQRFDPLQLVQTDRHVGTRQHKDPVCSGMVGLFLQNDDRAARRGPLLTDDVIDVDAGRLANGQHLLAVCIIADLADKRHIGTEPCRLNRLIRAFAAGGLLKRAPYNALPLLGEFGRDRDLIHDKAADNKDPGTAL